MTKPRQTCNQSLRGPSGSIPAACHPAAREARQTETGVPLREDLSLKPHEEGGDIGTGEGQGQQDPGLSPPL